MNNMPGKKSLMSLALGSAFAATLGAASIASAADSPFTAQPLNKGYMVADAHGYGDKGYGDKGYDKSCEGRCGMSMADTDKDGRVSRQEHARHCDMMFDKMDTNKDDYIDKDEASNWRAMQHRCRHGGSGDRSGYGGQPGYSGQWSDSGGRYTHYGERAGDHFLPHMKPMGE